MPRASNTDRPSRRRNRSVKNRIGIGTGSLYTDIYINQGKVSRSGIPLTNENAFYVPDLKAIVAEDDIIIASIGRIFVVGEGEVDNIIKSKL